MSETEVILHQGNCLGVMQTIEPGSVSFIFADLPYGQRSGNVTANVWDCQFDLVSFWHNCQRVRKSNAATVCSAKLRFAVALFASNPKEFRHDLVYVKTRPTRHHHAKRMPLSAHEHLLIFASQQPTYNPQMVARLIPILHGGTSRRSKNYTTEPNLKTLAGKTYTHRFPTTVLTVPSEAKQVHPTQKPIALLEWLIKTYTNDGDTILDPVAGSGTTALAALNIGNRKVICIEKDPAYFEVMSKRVADHKEKLRLVQ